MQETNYARWITKKCIHIGGKLLGRKWSLKGVEEG